MPFPLILLTLLFAGCAAKAVQPPVTTTLAPESAPAEQESTPTPEPEAVPAVGAEEESAPEPVEAAARIAPAAEPTIDDEVEGDDEAEAEGEDNPEAESHEPAAAAGANGLLYSADISDEELERLWTEDIEALGSMSVGFTDAGRLINGVQFPEGEGWTVVNPKNAWATQETVDYVVAAIRKVREQYPDAPPLRVNQISAKEGGYLRPHKSHQSGRDVDLAFYYPTADVIRVREREKVIDVRLTWALVKALVTTGDVQFILVDRRIQKVLYDYALRSGEDKKWLDSLFRNGANSILKHARRHRDHFHVRYYSPRAQELGRRVAPLLAKRPEHNIAHHRVRSGDTLSGIAVRYGSSVKAIMRANGMRNTFLRLGRVLKVPLRGPCNRCPVPPPVVVPPRRLPPDPASEPVAMNQQGRAQGGARVDSAAEPTAAL